MLENGSLKVSVVPPFGSSPLDVLVLVNDINQSGARRLPVNVPATLPYIDVDGDGTISPLDVLIIVNHLNQRSSGSGGEGEGEGGEGEGRSGSGGGGGGEMDPSNAEQLLNKIRLLKSTISRPTVTFRYIFLPTIFLPNHGCEADSTRNPRS